MRCQAIKKALAVYLDGELSPRTRVRVAAHVQECASCAQEKVLLNQVDQLLSQMTRLTPSPDFAETFWRRVEEEGQIEERSYLTRWWQDFVEDWRLAPALVATAVLLVVVSYVVLSSRVETSRVTTPSPAVGLPRELVEQPDLFLQYRFVTEVDKLTNSESILAQREEEALSGLTIETPPSRLLEEPGLFVDYYLLHRMEQLQNFEAVRSIHLGGEGTSRW